MANVYGSTLDSLMQNEAAQQASAQNERNSYRNYLNQIANTNLRRREGDSMDRYRMGDLDVRRGDTDVRRLDVTGMNDYRRGMTQNDANRIVAQERMNDRMVSGNERIAGMGLEGQKYVSDNTKELGTLQSNNQYNLGLDTNRTAVTNVGRQAQAQENVANTGANASMYNAGLAADANMYLADRSYDTAALPYNRLTATQQKIYDARGAEGLIPQDQNVRAIQAAAQTERDTADRTAYQNLLNQYDTQYQTDANEMVGFNDPRTKELNREMDVVAAERGITDPDQKKSLYDVALGRVVRRKFADRNEDPGFRVQPPARPAPLTKRKTRSGIVYEE